MNCHRTSIGKQIQKFLTTSLLANTLANRSMIEKQAGIQIVLKVNPKSTITFGDFMKTTFGGDALVLAFTSLSGSGFIKQVIVINIQRQLRDSDQLSSSKSDFLRINGLWRGILLNTDPLLNNL